MQTVIIHLDMNSYFASVEQQDYPEYRGKLLGVCEHLGGIIIAASVEAKRWGIKTGTPVWEAKKLYPKIILSHTHPNQYRHYNRLMVKVVGDYTDYVEKYSIDEVFLDVTKVCNTRSSVIARSAEGEAVSSEERDCFHLRQGFGGQVGFTRNDRGLNPFEEAIKVAKEIKARMKKEVGDYLRCSIGIAENKLLAKIGSDLQKPDGLVVIYPNMSFRANASEPRNFLNSVDKRSLSASLGASSNACPSGAPPKADGRDDTKEALILTKEDLYDRLVLTDIPGIAKRQEKRLNELGIRTLRDLRNYSYSRFTSVSLITP